MKTQISDGQTVTVTALAAVAAGGYVAIGELSGVALNAAGIGDTLVVVVNGVFALPKEATTDTFAVGAAVEWSTDKVVALAGGARVGVVTKAAIATDATVNVLLRYQPADLIE